jgi:hypothetical protein
VTTHATVVPPATTPTPTARPTTELPNERE